jgi:hypothetical protein
MNYQLGRKLTVIDKMRIIEVQRDSIEFYLI